jgi:hypothetical protein
MCVEIPFVPHESCIVDVSDFSGYADLSGYELVRLFDQDKLEFSLFDDCDALDQLEIQLINDDILGKYVISIELNYNNS